MLFKIERKLVRTYLIFNMADRLMNIQFKKCPALYDHSLPFQIGKSSVNSRNWSSLQWLHPTWRLDVTSSKFFYFLCEIHFERVCISPRRHTFQGYTSEVRNQPEVTSRLISRRWTTFTFHGVTLSCFHTNWTQQSTAFGCFLAVTLNFNTFFKNMIQDGTTYRHYTVLSVTLSKRVVDTKGWQWYHCVIGTITIDMRKEAGN